METSQSRSQPDRGLTSIHVRRAAAGDAESWAWIIERLSPLLELQASYRLRGQLRQLYDPEDLVHDVWMVAFAKLPSLDHDDRRLTPVLMRFLATTLMLHINALLRKHISREGRARDLGRREEPALADVEHVRAEVTTALRQTARSELRQMLSDYLARLRPDEQEVIVLRVIEQLPNETVAQRLGQKPSTVAMRYHRALAKLENAIPDSIFGEWR